MTNRTKTRASKRRALHQRRSRKQSTRPRRQRSSIPLRFRIFFPRLRSNLKTNRRLRCPTNARNLARRHHRYHAPSTPTGAGGRSKIRSSISSYTSSHHRRASLHGTLDHSRKIRTRSRRRRRQTRSMSTTVNRHVKRDNIANARRPRRNKHANVRTHHRRRDRGRRRNGTITSSFFNLIFVILSRHSNHTKHATHTSRRNRNIRRRGSQHGRTRTHRHHHTSTLSITSVGTICSIVRRVSRLHRRNKCRRLRGRKFSQPTTRVLSVLYREFSFRYVLRV